MCLNLVRCCKVENILNIKDFLGAKIEYLQPKFLQTVSFEETFFKKEDKFLF